MLENSRQAREWEKVQEFSEEQVLSVPQGHYVELNFTMRSWSPGRCLRGSYLEIRDGSDQSANLLGVFCGNFRTGVVRSSGRYMRLNFIENLSDNFAAFYTGRLHNETGMDFPSI